MKTLTTIVQNFIKQNKGNTSVYIIFVILLYVILDIVIPRIFSELFDKKVIQQQFNKFILIFCLVIFLLFLYNIFFLLVDRSLSTLIPKFNEYVNNYIYEIVLKNYNENYQELMLGKMMTNIILLPALMKDLFIEFVEWHFPSIVVLFVIAFYFLYLNWRIGLICLFSLGVSALFFVKKIRRCYELSSQRHVMYEKHNEYTHDRLNNLLNILSSAQNKKELEEREKIMRQYSKIYRDTMLCNGKVSSGLLAINTCFMIALLGLTIFLFRKKRINIKIFITIFVISLMYLSNIITISTNLPTIMHYLGYFKSAEKFLKNLNSMEKTDKPNGNMKADTLIVGDVVCKNVNYRFKHGNKILDNLNATFKKGQINGIIGSSGRGKTTLVNLLLRLYTIDSGVITIGGVNIDNITTEALRKNISLVTQRPKLFNESLYENIRYGNDISKKEIHKSVDEYGLKKIYDGVDFNRNVGVNGDELSGGQKQVAILLRIIAKKSNIIIMDEPTSSIDIHHKKYVINLIKKLRTNGKTVIIISHDPELQKIYENKIEL